MPFHFVGFMPRARPKGELIYIPLMLFHVEVTYIIIICSEYIFQMMIDKDNFMFVYYLTY